MIAIISDIHSNLEALKTVLADIRRRGIETIYCLGDIIGYGPDPAECLDLVAANVQFCLSGNHDHAVFYEPTNFNPVTLADVVAPDDEDVRLRVLRRGDPRKSNEHGHATHTLPHESAHVSPPCGWRFYYRARGAQRNRVLQIPAAELAMIGVGVLGLTYRSNIATTRRP